MLPNCQKTYFVVSLVLIGVNNHFYSQYVFPEPQQDDYVVILKDYKIVAAPTFSRGPSLKIYFLKLFLIME